MLEKFCDNGPIDLSKVALRSNGENQLKYKKKPTTAEKQVVIYTLSAVNEMQRRTEKS